MLNCLWYLRFEAKQVKCVRFLSRPKRLLRFRRRYTVEVESKLSWYG
jgi:hypothetical protein